MTILNTVQYVPTAHKYIYFFKRFNIIYIRTNVYAMHNKFTFVVQTTVQVRCTRTCKRTYILLHIINSK